MPKQKLHREHFWPLAFKKCRNCSARVKAGIDQKVWGWYEYHWGKKRHVTDVCPNCVESVEAQLKAHADPCGCTFELVLHSTTGTGDVVAQALRALQEKLNDTSKQPV